MPQMEFEVITDLTPYRDARIETNKEAVKAALAERVAPYKTLVVTPESKSNAKKDLADLRKIVNSIEEQRKMVKQTWMAPYMLYDADCKELTGEVNEAINNINDQVKAIETAEKEQKKNDLSSYFAKNDGGVSDYITFEDVFDPRWLNATFSIDEAKSIIDGKLEDTRNDLDALRGMESPYETAMLSEYAKSHNLGKALAEGKRLEAIQKAEEERKAKELAETFAEEETPAEEAEEPYLHVDVPRKSFVPPTPEYPPMPQIVRPVAEEESPKPKLFTLRFEVTGTAEAFSALKRCMTANGMEYLKI